MPDPGDKNILINAMGPLVTGLYASLDRALELAQQHFVDFDMTGREYQPTVHHLARAHGRRLLLAASVGGDLGRWQVARPRPNLQVVLYHDNIELRLLRPIGHDVPPPGRNPTRQAYYTNIHDNLLGMEGSRLLGLWSIDPKTKEMAIRVVRPIGVWKWAATAKLDIDFVLPRGINTLESLEFIPTEDLEVELPFAEEDDQDGEGNVGS